MYHLLTALAEDAEIILVGDPDQLASVDAGTVLGDIATFRSSQFSQHHHKRIEDSRSFTVQKMHQVLALAASIRASDVAQTFNVLQSEYSDVQWIEPTNGQAIDELVAEIGNYSTRLQKAAQADPELCSVCSKNFKFFVHTGEASRESVNGIHG